MHGRVQSSRHPKVTYPHAWESCMHGHPPWILPLTSSYPFLSPHYVPIFHSLPIPLTFSHYPPSTQHSFLILHDHPYLSPILVSLSTPRTHFSLTTHSSHFLFATRLLLNTHSPHAWSSSSLSPIHVSLSTPRTHFTLTTHHLLNTHSPHAWPSSSLTYPHSSLYTTYSFSKCSLNSCLMRLYGHAWPHWPLQTFPPSHSIPQIPLYPSPCLHPHTHHTHFTLMHTRTMRSSPYPYPQYLHSLYIIIPVTLYPFHTHNHTHFPSLPYFHPPLNPLPLPPPTNPLSIPPRISIYFISTHACHHPCFHFSLYSHFLLIFTRMEVRESRGWGEVWNKWKGSTCMVVNMEVKWWGSSMWYLFSIEKLVCRV